MLQQKYQLTSGRKCTMPVICHKVKLTETLLYRRSSDRARPGMHVSHVSQHPPLSWRACFDARVCMRSYCCKQEAIADTMFGLDAKDGRSLEPSERVSNRSFVQLGCHRTRLTNPHATALHSSTGRSCWEALVGIMLALALHSLLGSCSGKLQCRAESSILPGCFQRSCWSPLNYNFYILLPRAAWRRSL